MIYVTRSKTPEYSLWKVGPGRGKMGIALEQVKLDNEGVMVKCRDSGHESIK